MPASRQIKVTKDYLLGLLRPWKLCSFAIAMSWLLYGALNFGISDWDVGDSVIMGALTFLTAPFVVRTLLVSLRTRQSYWPLRIVGVGLLAWAVVDGSYTLYNLGMHHHFDRGANFVASLPLYLIAGFIWTYQGSLRDFIAEVRQVVVR